MGPEAVLEVPEPLLDDAQAASSIAAAHAVVVLPMIDRFTAELPYPMRAGENPEARFRSGSPRGPR
jgi:hypothetical protein